MRSIFLVSLFYALGTSFPIAHAFSGLSPHARHAALQYRTASPYTPQFPYTGAQINGLPGSQIGGVRVPASGDATHQYQDPPPGAQRGPCPGLNTAANHGFISRDGITTFDELVAAQQNLYNVGYDLAVLLATLGVVLDGDILTGKLSIGGDATAQTSFFGALGPVLGKEGGLNTHNTFESDTSLTRNDYFLADGDDHSFNGTLFGMMSQSAAANPSGTYDVQGLGKYRGERWDQSQADNENFYYGPKALLLYGAASFLYELFPGSGDGARADQTTISSFYGAVDDGQGGYSHVGERIPPNWYNRKTPYTILDVAVQIVELYLQAPRLFGGNVGPGNFDALGSFGNGAISGGNLASLKVNDVACLLYQLVATDDVPDSLSGILTLPVEALTWALEKLNPVFGPLGCPLRTIP